MKKTLFNCSLIKKMVVKGEGEPERYYVTCAGYPKSENDDEPCETCKKCILNYSMEKNNDLV